MAISTMTNQPASNPLFVLFYCNAVPVKYRDNRLTNHLKVRQKVRSHFSQGTNLTNKNKKKTNRFKTI